MRGSFLHLHEDDFPGAPHQQQGHDHVDGGVEPLVQGKEHGAHSGPDQVPGGGTARHSNREAQDHRHLEAVGQDVAGVGGDAQGEDLDVQKLQEEAVNIGEAGGARMMVTPPPGMSSGFSSGPFRCSLYTLLLFDAGSLRGHNSCTDRWPLNCGFTVGNRFVPVFSRWAADAPGN